MSDAPDGRIPGERPRPTPRPRPGPAARPAPRPRVAGSRRERDEFEAGEPAASAAPSQDPVSLTKAAEPEHGWDSPEALAYMGGGLVLLVVFVIIQAFSKRRASTSSSRIIT